MKRNEYRDPIEFEEGQLVLCRAIPLQQLRYKSAFYKAVPRWTLPFRVVRVLPSKKSAFVRCLLTGKTQEVHIQDVKFISPPQGEVQQHEWHNVVHTEAKSMFEPTVCRDVIEKFFEAINLPQLEPLPNHPRVKRRRGA
jgi:hypothetical protein